MLYVAESHRHIVGEGVGGIPFEGQASSAGANEFLGIFKTTAYGPPWDAMNGGGTTASGINLTGGQKYVVAADPSVLPLGTIIAVSNSPVGSHVFMVADTGGGIKGKHIDFFVASGRAAQNMWGVRGVKVEVIGRIGNGTESDYNTWNSPNQLIANPSHEKIPTSASIFGIDTPNWLGGFKGPSVGNAAAGAIDAITSVPQFLSKLFDPGTWTVVLKVIAGILLIGFGIKWLVEQK